MIRMLEKFYEFHLAETRVPLSASLRGSCLTTQQARSRRSARNASIWEKPGSFGIKFIENDTNSRVGGVQ